MWEVQIHGGPGEKYFEISVINRENVDHSQLHYGWFDENKLLISHNGGPCHWPLTKQVWNKVVKVAHEVAQELNNPPTDFAA